MFGVFACGGGRQRALVKWSQFAAVWTPLKSLVPSHNAFLHFCAGSDLEKTKTKTKQKQMWWKGECEVDSCFYAPMTLLL